MILLPYERFKIRTNLGKPELLERLADSIEPRVFFRSFKGNVSPFEGSIEGSHFEINRILRYRNSFQPMISGDIASDNTGCSISITMNLHIIVLIFMIFWLFTTGIFFISELGPFFTSLQQTGTVDLGLLVTAGDMFLFGYALMQVCFKIESSISKKFLRELFQAEEFIEMGLRNPFSSKK
jgi:hypothetical protein